jgi:hypothetical protein
MTWNTPLDGLRLRASGFDAHLDVIGAWTGTGGLPTNGASGNPMGQSGWRLRHRLDLQSDLQGLLLDRRSRSSTSSTT